MKPTIKQITTLKYALVPYYGYDAEYSDFLRGKGDFFVADDDGETVYIKSTEGYVAFIQNDETKHLSTFDVTDKQFRKYVKK